MEVEQFCLFEKNYYKIRKPIRTITLFSGYDSQNLALKYLGVEYEIWRTCEWAVKSIQALKDLHFGNDNTDYSQNLSFVDVVEYLTSKGISANYNEPMTREQIKRMGENKCRQVYNNIKSTHNMVNIQQVKSPDLGIIDTDKYDYIMTYSFPCQDLSTAGLGKGMNKNSGTRSGMLWEVERILMEIKAEGGQLPQVLLMENVPHVHGTKNFGSFQAWINSLRELGYNSFWQDLNSKDFGVPQNRERCFMVSVLGDYYYRFPQRIELENKLKDLLEDEVDEKFYLSDRAINGIYNTKFNLNKVEARAEKHGVMPTLCARDYKDPKLVFECWGIYEYRASDRFLHNKSRFIPTEVCLSLLTAHNYGVVINSNNKRLKDLVNKMDLSKDNQFLDIYNQRTTENAGTITTRVDASNSTAVYTDYRIRKLTPKEYFRLMGVKDEDFDKIAINQSSASLYHLAGDSIVANVLMEIFRQLL